LWPTAKAVGWPTVLTIKPASAGGRLPALCPIFLSPLRGLLVTLMLYPMAVAMGHILPPLGGSDGRGDLKLTPMGRCPRLLMFSPCGAVPTAEILRFAQNDSFQGFFAACNVQGYAETRTLRFVLH